jgi:hypothetical protein
MGKKAKSSRRVAPPILKTPTSTSSNSMVGTLRLYTFNDVVEDREFKTLLPERNLPELNELERSILANGVEEPIDIWSQDGKRIVVDGYTRLKICKKHNLSFKIRLREFGSREEVKIWIIKHQLERRNVTATERAYLIGYEYHRLKKNPDLLGSQLDETDNGGQNVHLVQHSVNQLVTEGGQNDHQVVKEGKVADRLAVAHNIGEKTVRRYEYVYMALAHIRKHNDELGLQIAAERTDITANDLERFAQLEDMPKVAAASDVKAALKEKPKVVKKKFILPNLDKNWKRTLSLIGKYHKNPAAGKSQKEAAASLRELIANLNDELLKIEKGE